MKTDMELANEIKAKIVELAALMNEALDHKMVVSFAVNKNQEGQYVPVSQILKDLG